MTQCGREITSQELEDIQETVELFRRLNRSELAKTICENLEWFTALGGYKVDACIKLLEILEKKGWSKFLKNAVTSIKRDPLIPFP